MNVEYPTIPVNSNSSLTITLTSHNRHALIIGGSLLAASIARSLLSTNTIITTVSQTICDELKVRSVRGEVGWLMRDMQMRDLDAKDMCFIADTGSNGMQVNEIINECRKRRILVSVVRRPYLGDFTIDHEPVKDDVFDDKEEPYQPPSPPRTPSPSLPFLHPPTTLAQRGTLTLVGAGPGAADLLTLRALNALRTADLVISDRLVSPSITSLITCPTLHARKTCGNANPAQQEIHNWALDALQQGKNVVRLKGGDPFLFGRGGEEYIFFRERGFKVDVIPGISSSLSAPLSALIPPTHRGVASQVLISTPRLESSLPTDPSPSLPTYVPHRTSVFLMAMGCLELLVEKLKGLGYPSNCPAAVVEKATCEDQRVVRGCLEDIAGKVREMGIKMHATLVVGGVVDVLHPYAELEAYTEPDVDVEGTRIGANVMDLS